MARYAGWTNSKSLNARAAESDGRFPATHWPQRLKTLGLFAGVTAADIKAAVETGEWHHVGSYAAKIKYYGFGEIFESRRQLRAAIAARKAVAKGEPKFPKALHPRAAVTFTEWEGKGRRKSAIEWSSGAAAVTQISETMVEIAGEFRRLKTNVGHRVFRKKLDGRWLKIQPGESTCQV